ncbi:MAG: hypothetical protein E6G97_07340 [Alphaproteobacteria bacterium]|nr:MAG: hypothetical protein E6G97_07340 [Alphaproteobacteria bacterium]
MTLSELNASLTAPEPPHGLAPPVQSLWWAAHGEWEKAHAIVMKDDSREAAWVHAYLHRVEGDLPNASYWYRTAGKPVATGTLETEWTAIAGALLGAGS